MKMEEELLTAGLQAVKDSYGDQIKELFGLEVIVPTTRSRWSSWQTCTRLWKKSSATPVDESEKGDLTTEAERLSYDWGQEALRPRVPVHHRLLRREARFLPHAR